MDLGEDREQYLAMSKEKPNSTHSVTQSVPKVLGSAVLNGTVTLLGLHRRNWFAWIEI